METPEQAIGSDRQQRSPWVANLPREFKESANVHMIFGEPVRTDEATVIPVGKIRFGFGGGSGAASDRYGSGEGGGGGVAAAPVGYIEIIGGKSRFQRIVSPLEVALTAATLGISFWLGMRGIYKAQTD